MADLFELSAKLDLDTSGYENGLTKALDFAGQKLTGFAKTQIGIASDLAVDDLPEDVRSSFYGDNDTHRMFIAEITACYVRE